MGLFSVLKKPEFYTSSEEKFYNLTLYSLILGLIYPVINDGSFFTNLVSVVCTGFSVLAICTFLLSHSLRNISFNVKFFGGVALYMLFIGILGGSFRVDKSTMLLTITQDIRYVSLFFLSGLYTQDERLMDLFYSLLKTVAFFAVVMGIIAAILIIQSGSLVARGGEDQTSYHYWWASTTCFAFSGLYSFFYEDHRKWHLWAFILYFIIGMSFLKRSCFLNAVFIVILSIILLSKQHKSNKLLSNVLIFSLLAFILSFVIPGVSSKVFGLLFDRFNDTTYSVDDFDRLIEFNVFQQNTTLSQRLLGLGIGNFLSYDRYGGGQEISLLNALHLGYANIIYKGGVLYAAFYIITYLKVFINWSKTKAYTSRYLICFGVSISALFSLLYEGSWTYDVLPFCISAPIFYAASYKGGE